MKRLAVVLAILTLVAVTAYAIAPKVYHSSNHPLLHEVRSNFMKIDPKYANVPLLEGSSAYTENKAAITLCLKDPKTGVYYDMNTIMYVALHELAHMITASTGHGKEFKDNFAKLLRLGAQRGFYNPKQPLPTTYCGVKNGE